MSTMKNNLQLLNKTYQPFNTVDMLERFCHMHYSNELKPLYSFRRR